MNIIFDTSIWVEYFKGNEPYYGVCQKFLEKGQVKGVDIIFAELLQGALNKREVSIIKEYYALVNSVDDPLLIIQAGDYSRNNKLFSKGIGLVDAIIIQATLTANAKLWTRDKKILKFLDSNYLYSEG